MDVESPVRVGDEEIETVWTGGTGTVVATVTDPQDTDGTDADGTDGDTTDGTDGDAGDTDGTDTGGGDTTDGRDA
jgi:hypothetical protein